MKRWPTMPLSVLLVKLETGSRPKGGVGEIPDGIPSLGGEHINREGGFSWETPKNVTRDFYAGMKRGHIQRGDILVVKDGATTGKTATVRENFPFRKAAINEHIFLLRTDKTKALPEFVGYFLFCPVGQRQILSNFRGAAIGGIPQDFVRSVNVPVPPLPDQERIVKLLDEADELRNLRAKADRRTAELIPALFYEMFGDPLANSRGWPTNELRQLGRVVTGSTPSSAKEGMFGGEIPFITPGDLERNTRLTLRHVTEVGAAEVRTVRAGGTLVCCIGATIGKTDRTWKRSAFNQQINAVEWGQQVDDDFGVVCMKQFSGVVIRQGSSTALPILKKSLFEQIRIPVPPISLQKEFAARVAEVRALEAEQAASRSRLDALFKTLLYNAFQGDL